MEMPVLCLFLRTDSLSVSKTTEHPIMLKAFSTFPRTPCPRPTYAGRTYDPKEKSFPLTLELEHDHIPYWIGPRGGACVSLSETLVSASVVIAFFANYDALVEVPVYSRIDSLQYHRLYIE